MSLQSTCSTSSVGMLHPFSIQKHTLSKSLNELSLFFEKTMQLIPHRQLTFAYGQTLKSRLKALDRNFIRYFHQRRSLRTSVDYLDLEVPMKAKFRVTTPKLEYLNTELPQIPFFHHSHPFDNLAAHQHLYEYVCDQRPHVMMNLIENLAARFFNSLEFLTTPLEAIENIGVVDESLSFRFPPKTGCFISQTTLSCFRPIKQKLLGQGVYGRVSLVKDMSSSYALKEFNSLRSNASECFKNLLWESANLLALPEHPSIVKIQAVNVEGIFFSYDHGISFSQLLLSEKTSYQSLCEYFLSIGQALEHLHIHGFVYLDLKEDNVIIEFSKPNAKLIDLGLVKQEKLLDDVILCPQITPPELILRSSEPLLIRKCDVWAFGILLYQSLTCGYLPFQHENRNNPNYPELVANFCKDFPCSIDRLFSQLSPIRRSFLKAKDPHRHLLELAVRCLNVNPALRPSMSEITILLSSYHQTNQK